MNPIKTAAVCAAILLAAGAGTAGVAELERDFRTLPMESRRLTGPLFWLHGDESQERLEEVLGKVLEGGNGTFTAESRPHSDWLGPGWYRDLAVCLDFAKKHNMTMWIFDEKWWPSGEVGGMVPEKYGSKKLVARAETVTGPGRVELAAPADRLVAALAGRETPGGVAGESLLDLTDEARDGRLEWEAPAGKWKVMFFTWEHAPGPGGRVLVDGASKEAVDWYLHTVYEPHYARFRDDFGRTIEGYFYDEPETPGDWGTEVIPLLEERGVDWKKALTAWKFGLAGEERAAARYAYQDALAEAWGRTLYGGIAEWCHARGVRSIGHFLEHNHVYLSQTKCAGNVFQLMKYSDLAGIDVVYRQLPPGRRPMGEYQMAKLASSVSHVYGKKDDLAMVEIFGARGQSLTYPAMKWQTDQVQVRGVNFIIPHSFNPRAPYDRDCPPYFYNGGSEPRYPLYRVYADYAARLSLMLSGGRHEAPVALLYLGQSAHAGRAAPPERMTAALQDALLDMDWVPYDVFENDMEIAGGELRLREERYRVLIAPAAETAPYATLAKAREFFEAGGVVAGYGIMPTRPATLGRTRKDVAEITRAVWGEQPRPGAAVIKTSAAGGRSYFFAEWPSAADLGRALIEDAGVRPALEIVDGKTDDWVHALHRVKDGMDIFFIANQNLGGGTRRLRLRVRAPGEPERWDPMRNEITAVSYRRLGGDEVEIELTLEPIESALVVFNAAKLALPRRFEDGEAAPLAIKVEREPGPGNAPGSEGWDRMRTWIQHRGRITQSPVTADPFVGRFELPADLDLAGKRVYVVCGPIKPEAAARIAVNRADAGGFIGGPLRVEVTRLVQPGSNTVVIEPFAPAGVTVAVMDE